MYTGIKFTNNASTQLVQPLLATDTTLYLATNMASIFPKLDTAGDYFLLTLFDINRNREVVKCTARTDSSCTIERAQEGTTAHTFPVGTLVELRLTADSITKVAEDASVTKPHASTVASDYGQSTAQVYGHAKITDNFELGTQAINGIICSPYALKQAVNRLTGVAGTTLITSSTTYVVPETGTYTITCVGGGGAGGTGGGSAEGAEQPCEYCNYNWYLWSGGGAGGGGAGQVRSITLQLTKGTSIPVIVGGTGGNSSFGSYLTSLAGARGNNGGNAYGGGCSQGNMNDYSRGGPGGGGAGGYSYGSPAVNGAGGGGGSQAYATYYGGIGGNGGVSAEGTYGNGGKGGNGQLIYNPQAGCDTHYGPINVGASGMQGCVKITMKLGS